MIHCLRVAAKACVRPIERQLSNQRRQSAAMLSPAFIVSPAVWLALASMREGQQPLFSHCQYVFLRIDPASVKTTEAPRGQIRHALHATNPARQRSASRQSGRAVLRLYSPSLGDRLFLRLMRVTLASLNSVRIRTELTIESSRAYVTVIIDSEAPRPAGVSG